MLHVRQHMNVYDTYNVIAIVSLLSHEKTAIYPRNLFLNSTYKHSHDFLFVFQLITQNLLWRICWANTSSRRHVAEQCPGIHARFPKLQALNVLRLKLS